MDYLQDCLFCSFCLVCDQGTGWDLLGIVWEFVAVNVEMAFRFGMLNFVS